MPRNMSFMLTVGAVRSRTKTVTRRGNSDGPTWRFLKPGDVLNACVKCQGLKKGEKVVKITQIRVLSTKIEQLGYIDIARNYGNWEVIREGFPNMSPEEFVAMYCKHNGTTPRSMINRIAFNYIDTTGAE